MLTKAAHVAVYDTLADWEIGHLLAELRSGRFTGTPWTITTVARTLDPVTTMGGLTLQPDLALSDLDPDDSGLLVLTGADFWDQAEGDDLAELAGTFLNAGVPVAAICGATFGLARAGLLDQRRHTSAVAEYLQASGYAGAELYVDERAVADQNVITAGPQSPIHFATATLGHLGLASEKTLTAYEGVFHHGDASFYGDLMAGQAA